MSHSDGTRMETQPSADSREPAAFARMRPWRRIRRCDFCPISRPPRFLCPSSSPPGVVGVRYGSRWVQQMSHGSVESEQLPPSAELPEQYPITDGADGNAPRASQPLFAFPLGYAFIIYPQCVIHKKVILKKHENFVNVVRIPSPSAPSHERKDTL